MLFGIGGFMKNKNQKSWKNSHFIWLVLLFFVALLILLPLFMNTYHAGHDTKYHLANVLAIENQIEIGHIPTSPILDKIGYGLGYGTRLFYPPLSHTVTAYLFFLCSHIHFTVTDTLKLAHFLALFLSGCAMYFLSYHLSKNKKIAFISAIIYMSFPYHISDIYVRDSLAECFLYPFLPMILLGVCHLLDGNTKKFYPLFVLGYVGGMLSHLTLMIYFTILVLIFLFISKKIIFTKEKIIPLLFASISILGITCFFTSSVLENHLALDYVVFESGEMTKRIVKTALYPFEYLNIFPPLQSSIKFYFPIALLLLLGFTMIKRKKIEFPKYTKNFLVIGLVAFFLSTKLFPWKIMPSFFQMIQFPWRFEIFVGLIASLLAPLCLSPMSKEHVYIIASIFLIASSYAAITFSNHEVLDLESIWWNGGMGWQKEYLPVVAKKNQDYLKKKKQTISFEEGKGTYQILQNEVPSLTIQFQLEEPSMVEFPRIYYPGYKLVSSEGEEVLVESSTYGLLQSKITKSGVYHLKYVGSNIHNLCKKVSIITLILSVFSYFIYLFKRKKYKI